MDSKCFEIERVMEGTGNLIENRFPLSQYTGTCTWVGSSLQLLFIFLPREVFFFVFKLCFVVFEKAYSMPTFTTTPQAGSLKQKWGLLGRRGGLDGLPLAWVLETAM